MLCMRATNIWCPCLDASRYNTEENMQLRNVCIAWGSKSWWCIGLAKPWKNIVYGTEALQYMIFFICRPCGYEYVTKMTRYDTGYKMIFDDMLVGCGSSRHFHVGAFTCTCDNLCENNKLGIIWYIWLWSCSTTLWMTDRISRGKQLLLKSFIKRMQALRVDTHISAMCSLQVDFIQILQGYLPETW